MRSLEAVLTDCGMENVRRTYLLMLARARVKYDRAATAASFTSEFKDLLDAAKVAKNEQLCYIRQRLTTGCDSLFKLFVLLGYLDVSLGFERHQFEFDVVFSTPSAYHLTIRTEIDVAQVDKALPSVLPSHDDKLRAVFLRAKTVLARLFSVSSIFSVDSLYPMHRINSSRQKDVITSSEEEGQVVLSAAFRDVSTSSELNYTVNIDGFFAHAAVLDVYRALKAPLMLKLRSTPESMVSTHHLVYNNNGEFLDVRRCVNIKLGYIKTAIGEANVYLTLSRLPNENIQSIEETLNYVYSIKAAVTSSPAINIKKDASVPTDPSKTCVLVDGSLIGTIFKIFLFYLILFMSMLLSSCISPRLALNLKLLRLMIHIIQSLRS